MSDGFLKAAELSDIGRQRKRNEDASLCAPDRGIFAVFDGMGGASGGEEASRIARECLQRKIEQSPPIPSGLGSLKAKVLLVRAALNDASRMIRERADARGASGSGTTAVVLVFDEAQPQRAIILHAGDSRAYRCRRGELTQLTRDHSFAVAAGVVSERSLPPMFRGVVTRAVGLEAEVILEETLVDSIAGDLFLLCTDGLTKMIADGAIAGMLGAARADNLMRTAHVLVEEANAAGGQDNTTVVVIAVSTPSAAPAPVAVPRPAPVEHPVPAPPASAARTPVPVPPSPPVPAVPPPAPVHAPAPRPAVVLEEERPGADIGLIGAAVLAAVLVVGIGFWMLQGRGHKGGAVVPATNTPALAIAAAPTAAVALVERPVSAPPASNVAAASRPAVVPSAVAVVPTTTVTTLTRPLAPAAAVTSVVAVSTAVVAAVPVPPPVVAPVMTQAVAAVPPVVAPPRTADVVAVSAPTSAPVVVAVAVPPVPPAQTAGVVATVAPVVVPRPVPPALPLGTSAAVVATVVDTRSPADIAAAQAMMEMLMTDIVTALGAGHWDAVEETLSEWAPSAPRESAQIRSWSVYRGWAAIWREASTGVRPASELFEPYRVHVLAALAEIGATNTMRFTPVWNSHPKRNADLLCQGRFRGQTLLVEELRAKAEEAARLASTLNEARIVDTAMRLREQSGRGPDGRKALADFSIRAELLGAATREARGNPVPLEPADLNRLRDGWTGMRVAEELVWQALLEGVREPVPAATGSTRSQMEALRTKALDSRRSSPSWAAWLAGDGPSATLKYLILAARTGDASAAPKSR